MPDVQRIVFVGPSAFEVIELDEWSLIEAILFKAMGIGDMTKAVRSKDKEKLIASAEGFAVIQGVLDEIYEISAAGKVAQSMLDGINERFKEDT